MFDTIMVPTDGSEDAKRAEDMAISLAKELGSKVVAVHIIDDKLIYPYEVLENEGKAILNNVQKKGQQNGVEVSEILIVGSPTHDMAKITEKAEADLVIISPHGKSSFEKILMGSVAESTVKTVDLPVLLAK
ncbi:MAG: Universal stress protein [Methanobacterium sp. PtaB.Bin024]|jgi:nucleotide-binding universal stress UspA family protein|nr:MAG: Universal stress protein [Methanobacterium sp. PtaB.Bin024]